MVALSQGDVREDRRAGLCYTMLLGELTIYSIILLQDGGCEIRGYLLLPSILFYCCKMEVARSVVFDWISYPPLILLSAVHSTYITPFTQISLHM